MEPPMSMRRRTRGQEAIYLRAEWEKRRRISSGGGGGGGGSESGSTSGRTATTTSNGGDSSEVGETRVRGSCFAYSQKESEAEKKVNNSGREEDDDDFVNIDDGNGNVKRSRLSKSEVVVERKVRGITQNLKHSETETVRANPGGGDDRKFGGDCNGNDNAKSSRSKLNGKDKGRSENLKQSDAHYSGIGKEARVRSSSHQKLEVTNEGMARFTEECLPSDDDDDDDDDSEDDEDEVEDEEEEEEEQSEDVDYNLDEEHCCSLEESISEDSDGDEGEDMEDCNSDEVEVVMKGRSREDNNESSKRLKRKNLGEGNYCTASVAKRTRSNFILSSKTEKTKKNRKVEIVTGPRRSNVDGSSSSSDIDTSDENDGINDDDDDEVGEKNEDIPNVKVGIGIEKERIERNYKWRKSVPNSDTDLLFKLFLNTMSSKSGGLEEDHIHDGIKNVFSPMDDDEDDEPLPLKFSFGMEETEPVKKSDYENQMDKLWAEMDLAQSICAIGTSNPLVDDTVDANLTEGESDPRSLCSQGKHDPDPNVDEQIGITCRICSAVLVPIKNLFAPMTTAKSERFHCTTYADNGDSSMQQGISFGDADCNSQGSFHQGEVTVWDLVPGYKNKVYPHQQEGFEFMWTNLAGSIYLDKLKKSDEGIGGGCVISHAPGTGKSHLTLLFIRSFMEFFKDCKPLLIAPASMLLTWEEEIKKWNFKIPFHNLNSAEFSSKECLLHELGKGKVQNKTRMTKLISWWNRQSILGISYNLFVKLAGNKQKGDAEDESIKKVLLEKPNLLVLDEGHTPRNDNSLLYKALRNMKTERRIILSGTPFQNNSDELFNTLWMARPKFADNISMKPREICKSKSKLDEWKEAKKRWTRSVGKLAHDKQLDKVKDIFSPFVHIHTGNILKQNLPGLRDCVVFLYPTPEQKLRLKEVEGIKDPFTLEHAVGLISVHPSLSTKCKLHKSEKILIDKIPSKRFKLDPCEGVKTKFLIELIQLAGALNEKVLVFSQYIDPLNLIRRQLCARFHWTEGEEVLKMDGKQSAKERQSTINLFNERASKVRVLLASIKACGEGINLVGASRVVLLDVVWNPSVERQAISRAYRLGQEKVVYTYQLISCETMEEKKFNQQSDKDRMSSLLFSSTHGDRQNGEIPHDRILEELCGHDKVKDIFKKIVYRKDRY